jgi:hypothetical protein
LSFGITCAHFDHLAVILPSKHVHMLFRCLPAVALLFSLTLSSLAFAVERAEGLDLPTPDKAGTWRWMTQDPETTTSRCIGETKTPLCTIETFLACRIRADRELCRIAAVEDEYGNYSLHRDEYTRYRVTGVTRWDERNLGRRPWEVGDLWIDVLEWDCNPHSHMAQDRLECRKFDRRQPPIGYVLHKAGDQWRIVFIYTPRY